MLCGQPAPCSQPLRIRKRTASRSLRSLLPAAPGSQGKISAQPARLGCQKTLTTEDFMRAHDRRIQIRATHRDLLRRPLHSRSTNSAAAPAHRWLRCRRRHAGRIAPQQCSSPSYCATAPRSCQSDPEDPELGRAAAIPHMRSWLNLLCSLDVPNLYSAQRPPDCACTALRLARCLRPPERNGETLKASTA